MNLVFDAWNYALNNFAVLLPNILTAVYIYLTFRILKAGQRQTAITVRPYVSFDLIPVGPVIAAHLRNTGQTTAHNVVVKIKPELLVTLFGETGPAKLIGHPMTILSPGREEIEVIGAWFELKAVAPDLAYTGTVEYSEASGKRHKEPFRIELSARGEMMGIGTPSTAESLQTLSEHLKDIKALLEKQVK